VRCSPWRLAADFRRHAENMPAAMTLFTLTPTDGAVGDGVRKRVQGRFVEWRKRIGIAAGVYGVRVRSVEGVLEADVLLAVPDEDAAQVESSRAFAVERVAEGQDAGQALEWWQVEFMAESVSWSDTASLTALERETKGTRRFQGFGRGYERAEKSDKPLGKVSGGSGHGGGKQRKPPCPCCGNPVTMEPGTVPASQVFEDAAGNFWWKPLNGPPR